MSAKCQKRTSARSHSITFGASVATLVERALARLECGLSEEIQHGRISEAHRITLAASDVTHDEQC
jgi:hypothetical protein